MMVAITEDNGRLILGLTTENLRRLCQGKPILVARKTHGEAVPAGLEIVIIYGDDERTLLSQLRAAGLVTPETEVRVDARLGDITNPPPGDGKS